MGKNWVRVSCALLGTMLLFTGWRCVSAADVGQRTISARDCSFNANRDDFLARESRIRRDISDRAVKVNGALARSAAAAPLDAAAIPRQNFIDDAIFGDLDTMGVPAARLTTDEEFFRRINLDLIGRIPTPDAVRAFVADTNPSKRNDVIDSLLYSVEFIYKWTMWLGDLLQNTAASANVNRQNGGRDAFYNWIRSGLNNGKSLKDMAYECVSAVGNSFADNTGCVNFAYGMTTPMGPIQDTYDTYLAKTSAAFLGITSYDCLLCHNGRGHLDQISLWGSQTTRPQAQQMAAFFARVRMVRSPAVANSEDVTDAASGGYDLNTNFGNRPDRLPIGTVRSLTPMYRLGGEPDGAWRASFAAFMTADPMFARNFANRIWKQLFNLGMVDPVDTMDPARLDPANPPPAPWALQATHPELLERLAAELVQKDYNLREFIRTLVRSSAYQLSSRYDGDWQVTYVPLFARHYPRRLDAEEIADAIVKATGIAGGYTVAGWSDTLTWAMQMPDTTSGGGPAAFLNSFLRGNRDNLQRSQAGSIIQQLNLMNDPFVLNRTKVAASPVLQSISQMSSNDDVVEQTFLTFLSRFPTAGERQAATAALAKTTRPADRNAAIEDLAWACINKLDFLFSY
jgi:uncharacterized protein DUF1553/uncharacterized protein DUF1549